MASSKASFEMRASEVLNAVFDLDYKIQTPDEFRRQLQTKKTVAMPVESSLKGDYITEDFDAFMNYVRLNGIKTVMYTFRFYTEEDVETLFKLSQADRAFFVKEPDYDGLEEYQRYLSYVSAAVDLERPNSVSLYVLHNQAVIQCTVEDMWMERLPLLNAQTIRKTCVDSMSYSGSNSSLIRFRFIYDTANLTNRQDMLKAPAVSPDMFTAEEDRAPERSIPSDLTDIPLTVSDITEEPETAQPPVPEIAEEPAETVEPIVPEIAEEPAETVEPIIPEIAEEPAETVEPIVPETAEDPAETVEPIVPEIAEEPAETVEPIAPEIAEEPAETVEPIVPEIAEEPAETVEPIAPEIAEEPAETPSGSDAAYSYAAPDLANAASEVMESRISPEQVIMSAAKKQRGLFKKKKRR